MKYSFFSPFSLITYLVLITSSFAHPSSGENSQDVSNLIVQQQKMIKNLQAQIDSLTVTEEKLSNAAAQVRSSCAADFQMYCEFPQIEVIDIIYNPNVPETETKPQNPVNPQSGSESSDSHSGSNSHSNSESQAKSNSHPHDSQANHAPHDRHDNVGRHEHGHFYKNTHLRKLFSSDSSSFDGSSIFGKKNGFPGMRIGFGSFENDQCMMSYIMELSSECQSSINEILELNEDYKYQNQMDSQNQGCRGGLIVLFLIILVLLPCIAHRRRRHFMKMKKFVDVMYENPEVRGVVEGIVGEQLPPRPKCCMMNPTTKKIIHRSFLAWLISSTIVAIFFIATGTPADLVFGAIFSATFNFIFLILFCVGIYKLLKCCCCCCFRKRNNSNQCSMNTNVNQFPGQNRLNLEPIIFQSPSSAPFQYQPIPKNENNQSNTQNSSTNQHPADYFGDNGNIQMIYAGIPVSVPPNV
jgi:hypothetical protein